MIVDLVKAHKRKLAFRLELLNEVILILVIESLYLFTSVMNAGNVNDVDLFGNQYNNGTSGSVENLEKARLYAGYYYISLFITNIAIQLFFLLKD